MFKRNFKYLLLLYFIFTVCVSELYADMSGQDPPLLQETFFTRFVLEGGPIVWLILLPMSVVTLYLAIDLFFSIRKSRLIPSDLGTIKQLLDGRLSFPVLKDRLLRRKDILSKTLLYVFEHASETKLDARGFRQCSAEFLNRHSLHMMKKVQWCNIIGSVAPMVGLFGTVFGMIKAFNVLGIAAGQPRPDQLASEISVALLTTFWGLLVAIPALSLHGVFQSRIETIFAEAAIETEVIIRAAMKYFISHQEQFKLSDEQKKKAVLSGKSRKKETSSVKAVS